MMIEDWVKEINHIYLSWLETSLGTLPLNNSSTEKISALNEINDKLQKLSDAYPEGKTLKPDIAPFFSLFCHDLKRLISLQKKMITPEGEEYSSIQFNFFLKNVVAHYNLLMTEGLK